MTDIKAPIDGVTEINGEYWDDYATGKIASELAFDFGVPRNKYRNKILKTVYTEKIRDKKPKLINKIALHALNKGENSLIASELDEDYKYAQKETFELYMKLYRQFIGLYFYNSEGYSVNLVAFSSIPGLTVTDTEGIDNKITFNDIFITERDGYEKDPHNSIDMVSRLYSIFLTKMDEIALHSCHDDKIDVEFITQGFNDTLWAALDEHGYLICDSPDLDDGFYRFGKTLVRETKKDEGNYSR